MTDEKKTKEVFTEKDLKQVQEGLKEKAQKDIQLTPDEIKKFNKVLGQFGYPVKIANEDFQLGQGEQDIRFLSAKNKDQLDFRFNMMMVSYLRETSQTMGDILRMLMVIALKMGVQNITQSLGDMLDQLNKEREDFVKKTQN